MDNIVLRYHVSKVYELVFMTLMTFGLGAITNYYFHSGVAFSFGMVMPFILIFMIAFDNKISRNKNRYYYMLPFGFLFGLTMWPILQIANMENEMIVPIAALSTFTMFAFFTFVSKFIHEIIMQTFGFVLLSLLNTLCIFGLMHLFFGIGEVVEYVYIGIGLVTFSGLIAYDTAVMYERFRNNDIDYIVSAIDLFLDIINIFAKLLRILTKISKDLKKK